MLRQARKNCKPVQIRVAAISGSASDTHLAYVLHCVYSKTTGGTL